ncbi:phosphate/phosphite/phosphonate ABC transporter substrate-binding protein [Rugamonas sp. DEMB1]|uniref:phosphate/phosphite/phosphonate ABC transporter substrate-binding protein n=1 Tax=Rugamonas sp. DEMB1 TaxID=3039386 RepID=UPI0024469509|nr:PhnD/SsuA/transferrin family substrate-binding protein [Rugamonas sp. DEMB1]WGG48229.1 PhnD/SsuA/transferrin family substrate-binding protein [Rugamonas sp. DEMB1]
MSWTMSLPMYNVSTELRDGYEALQGALLDLLRAAGWRGRVEALREPPLPDLWRRPDLLLSQTCGYPYATALSGRVRLLATPCYDFTGCRGSDYSSAIVVRQRGGIGTLAEARGRVAAVNDAGSHSGMNALRHAVAPLAERGRFFGAVRWSGSHAASLALLRGGAADIAAIDCVSLGYLLRCDPACLAGLAVLQYSTAAPGLPLIAGAAVPEEAVRLLREALLAPPPRLQELLRPLSILGFERRGAADYAGIALLEAEARAVGYAELA